MVEVGRPFRIGHPTIESDFVVRTKKMEQSEGARPALTSSEEEGRGEREHSKQEIRQMECLENRFRGVDFHNVADNPEFRDGSYLGIIPAARGMKRENDGQFYEGRGREGDE